MNEILSEQSYRAKPWFAVLTVVVMVFWIGAGIFLVNYFYSKTDNFTSKSVLVTLFGSVVMILISVSGIWQGLAYWRQFRLTLSPQAITQVIGPETNVLAKDEITGLNWLSMSDEIILNSETDKLMINLDHFKRSDQHAIIAFLRNAVPLEQQEKWKPFSELRRRSIDPDMPLTTREWLMTAFWLMATVSMGYQWWTESGWQWLVVFISGICLTIRSYRGT
ncbi:hypothetical protein [Gimesia sp.]|uniref:hypothetical protein n=1 Tax=Gimesia sp. TaxID=2024833 RepID=UPI003A94F297